MKRQEIIDFARTFIGVKYRHMGRNGINNKMSGLDCAGIPVCICDHFGIPYRDLIGTYSNIPRGGQIERVFSKWLTPIDKDDCRVGSMALMYQVGWATRGLEPPQHAFLVTRDNPLRVLHAHDSPSFRKVVESVIPHGYCDRITHRFDFPGVED